MNYLLQQRGLADQVSCDSAGTSSYHVGSSPDQRMSAAAERKLGFTLKGSARQFELADFQGFDMVLAMDQDNYEHLYHLDSAGNYRDRLKLMCEFCTENSLKSVPDPYYGGEDGFNFVIDLLMDACNGLIDTLVENGSIKR